MTKNEGAGRNNFKLLIFKNHSNMQRWIKNESFDFYFIDSKVAWVDDLLDMTVLNSMSEFALLSRDHAKVLKFFRRFSTHIVWLR